MVNKMAAYMTEYIVKNGKIRVDEYKIYQYGFTILIEIFMVTFTCLFISGFGGRKTLFYGIEFFLVFIPLRKYGGGFHFAQFRNCYILSVIVYSIVILATIYFPFDIYAIFASSFLLLFLFFRSIFVIGTKNSTNKKRNDTIKFEILIAVISIIIFVLYKNSYGDYAMVISSTLVLDTISIIVKKEKNIGCH